MKKLFVLLVALFAICSVQAEKVNHYPSVFAQGAKKGDKIAIVMLHFGTTQDDTRLKTIEVLNERVKATYPQWDFYEAYTSRIILNLLKKRGVEKPTPTQVLHELVAKGYKYVLLQSSNIIDGIEMESVRKEIASVSHHFEDVRLGNCLLYSPEDCDKVTHILQQTYPAQDVVWVGHGTYTPATATYVMVDYMLKMKGCHRQHVATIEGYPTVEDAKQLLRRSKAKRVTLVPLMFVAGVHAKEDIDGEWKEIFQKEGYHVKTELKGLGEYPAIIDLFMEHIRFATQYKTYDIMDKKAKYANDNN